MKKQRVRKPAAQPITGRKKGRHLKHKVAPRQQDACIHNYLLEAHPELLSGRVLHLKHKAAPKQQDAYIHNYLLEEQPELSSS
jgi:hypothetical protein